MFVTIISDCRDDNAFGRQAVRVAALFGSVVTTIHTIGVVNETDASGNLVDVLDAACGAKGIVLVNVAPRHSDVEATGWLNGTPFAYFFVGDTLVLSSIGGDTLSLVKKLGIVDMLNLLDIPTVMDWAFEQGLITADVAENIITSQFRSFEFLPRAAFWLHRGETLPKTAIRIADVVRDTESPVWYVDCFGNCKTTMLPYEDVGKLSKASKDSTDAVNALPFYAHLKDVPEGTLARIIGSSGFGKHRFLEIVLKGGSAGKYIIEAP